MSLIREKSPPRRRAHLPNRSTTYILIALAVLTLGLYLYPSSQPTPRTNQTSQWKDSPYGPIIGIDIGHAYTRAAIVRNRTVEMITDSRGVSNILTRGSRWSFNNQSRDEFPPEPRGLLGFCQRALKHNELTLDQPLDWNEPTDSSYNWLPVAQTLRHIRAIASENLGESVTHAVLTVPAYTTDTDRQAFKDVANRIGLTILRVTDASKAACFAHGLDKRGGESNVTVVDVGAEALRVSVLNIDDGVYETLGESHSNTLGGDAYNERILDWLVGIDGPAGQMRRQLEETEMIKEAMSKSRTLIWSKKYPIKEAFEAAAYDLLHESPAFIERVLKLAGVNKTDIESLVITGGSSKIPQVQAMVESYFGMKSMVLRPGEPEEAAARGAAVLGDILNWGDDHDCTLDFAMNFTMIPLGIETSGGLFQEVIPRNSFIPARYSKQLHLPRRPRPDQSIKIRAFAGMRNLVKGNILLGELELPLTELGSNLNLTMFWNEDDSMGFAVHTSSRMVEVAIPPEISSQITWDMVDTMFDDIRSATTVEAGGTLEAKAQVKVLQQYITSAQASLVLDQPGQEKREELEFINDTLNWMIATDSEFSLEDVNEKSGQARAVVEEGWDGLPVLYKRVVASYL